MSCYAGYFHDIQPLLKQPSSRLVAQIVKAQALDAGAAYGTDIGAFDGFGCQAEEDFSLPAVWQFSQYPLCQDRCRLFLKGKNREAREIG